MRLTPETSQARASNRNPALRREARKIYGEKKSKLRCLRYVERSNKCRRCTPPRKSKVESFMNSRVAVKRLNANLRESESRGLPPSQAMSLGTQGTMMAALI